MRRLALALALCLPCAPALAQTCSAWTQDGPASTGPLMGSRAFLPGLTLSPDLALFCGDSEEPAWFDACYQLEHGVVCVGVRP